MRRRVRRTAWLRGLPDRSGPSAFVVLVRDGARDPERRLRGLESGDARPHVTVGKTPPEEWAARIDAHVSDGRPRTLNRIAVEMLDKTADVVFGTTFDAGLWLLVERGRLEYTPDAPVYFRRAAWLEKETTP